MDKTWERWREWFENEAWTQSGFVLHGSLSQAVKAALSRIDALEGLLSETVPHLERHRVRNLLARIRCVLPEKT